MQKFNRDGFTPLNSSHLDGVKYQSLERKMTVRFKNGAVYDVYGVAPEDHQAFVDADSHGEHFHAHIKNSYSIVQVK